MKLIFLLICGCFARAPLTYFGRQSDVIEGEYLVKFRNDAEVQFEKFKGFRTAHIRSPIAVQEFGEYRGFAAQLDEEELDWVQNLDGVEYVEPNQKVEMLGEQHNVEAWGIDRSDQRGLPLNGIYRWDDNTDGSDVDVFILDTGINTEHPDFEGRAHFAVDCTSTAGCNDATDPGDPQGHGTHCAGSVGSKTYGIAKNVRLHNVRVLSASGSGTIAGIINGVSWVNKNSAHKRIISMSLGGGYSQAMNEAVDASHRAGVLNVIAAGNSNRDTCGYSPASAVEGIAVGATDRNDQRASFSNYGTCTDIFAPGVGILSTSRTGATDTFSGTSMACPHVAGACALIWSRGDNLTASDVRDIVLREATSGLVGNPGPGSPNLLLHCPLLGETSGKKN